MSCILDPVVGKLVEPIVNIAYQKVGRHVGYVVNYKENMKELEDEKKKLEMKLGENVRMVEEASTRGEIVEENVKEWVQEAENMKHGVEELMKDKAINESTRCLKLPCPNLVSRYKMSKESKQMQDNLEKQIGRGMFDTVAHPAPRALELQFTSGDFVSYGSRKPVLKKIIDGLRNPTINTIGVYGTGGIGKTKAVEEVAKQVKEQGIFDEVVIAAVSQNVNICEIQRILAGRLVLSFKSKETKEVLQNKLWNRLKNGKKNLVILDDIWQELDLRTIGIPSGDENKGCKVIFTTRNLDVLKKMKVDECVSVQVLSDTESWNLFNNKVGIAFDSPELHSIAKLVCKECRGLPVAILAVGGALMGKHDMHVWSDVLDQLQNSTWESIDGIDPKMYASLRLSYDYLGKEAQSILLLCCLYPEDADIPVNLLIYHCIGRRLLGPGKKTVEKARDRVFTLVGSLKTCSLLLDGKDRDFVKMHDVVRDVIISIARNKNNEQYLVKDAIDEWPNEYLNEKTAAVSVRFNKLKEVPNELKCPGLNALRIESRDSSFQFPDSFFKGVGELRILELKGISMLCPPPSSLANLSKLRTLILVNCQLEDMSFLKDLRSSLEVLVIESCDIKALAMELGELSRLRVLLLNESHNLEFIPSGVISKLTQLEELRFPDEFDFRVYNESGEIVEDTSRATLSELSSLTKLTSLSVFIPNEFDLNHFISFGNLVSYRLAVGQKFKSEQSCHPLYQMNSGRKIVKLADTTYNDAFDTLLKRAEKVHLVCVEGLKEGILERLFEVERLTIEGCNGLDSLSSRTSFSKLTQLYVKDCSFKFLFTSSCEKRLEQLRELKVGNCELLEEIIGTEGEIDDLDRSNHFSKLIKLELSNLPKLISFGPKGENTTAGGVSLFSEKLIFPALKSLYISELENITEIWDKHVVPTTSFPRLVYVSVLGFDKLVNVFPSYSYSWAQILQTIKVLYCKGVQVVFSITEEEEEERDRANNSSIIFPKLRSVELFELEKLERFCGNSTRSVPLYLFDPQLIFPALEDLYIWGLENITEIWDKHVVPTTSFPQLEFVRIWNCGKLVNVFSSYSWTQILQTIDVSYCKGVQVVFSITEEEEEERDSANNRSIIFPKLRSVKLMNLEKLERFCGNSNRSVPLYLFDPQLIFPVLEDLTIWGLENITEIWDKHVVPTTSFPQLSRVFVMNCDKLMNVFPSYSYSWAQSLQGMRVSDCKGVQVVFSITEEEEEERDSANNRSIIFPKLRYVMLEDLEKLERFCGNSNRSEPLYLFDPQVQFPALEYMTLSGLPGIETFREQVSARGVIFPAIRNLKIEGVKLYIDGKPNTRDLESENE